MQALTKRSTPSASKSGTSPFTVIKTLGLGEEVPEATLGGGRRRFRDVPVGAAVGIAGDQLVGCPISAIKPKADPIVEIEPGEFSPEDLAKRIYRTFAEKEKDRRRLKSVASVDLIVSFLPPGGSSVKG